METNELSLKRRIQVCCKIIGVAWQVRRYAIFGYFSGAILEIASFITGVYATAKLASLLATFINTGKTDYIWVWLWVDVAATITTGLAFLLMNYFKRMLYFTTVRRTINAFQEALCRIDLADYYDTKTRNEINKVTGSYIWQMPNLSDHTLDLAYGILRFSTITFVVAQITWWIVPLIALFLLPTLLAESRMAKMQWFVWDTKGDFRHIFWGFSTIIQQAKGQMELRSTQAKNFVLKKIDTMNKEFYQEQEKKYRNASKALVPTKILEAVGTAAGSIVLLRQFLSHAIPLDRYFFLSGSLLRIGSSLNTVFSTLSYMQEGLLLADGYFRLIEKQPRLVDPKDAIKLNQARSPRIKLENISFKYPDHDNYIFKNLSLDIEPGDHIALVGENGAGKSTLIKLLLRFYQPDSGRILIDGVDLQNIAIDSWYSQLATLFQDFNRYPLTIAENIEIGRSDTKINKDTLRNAAKFGGVNQMVENYEHGWETVLDASFKKGVEPSGGQWQRVALSRAFYRNANMIILDEPTSAIDAKAEYDIFNNIFEHYEDKTALIVSHRFSTVRRADRIVVLEHGKVMEQGSHKDLMKLKGLYHELFTKQAEGYQK